MVRLHDPTVLKDFELETSIKVNFTPFDTQEVMEAKMLTGSTGYDVVDVAGYAVAKLAQAGVLQRLDLSRFQHWNNLDRELLRTLEQSESDAQYAVGYLWGTTGIGVNAAVLLKEVPDAPMDSWVLAFDPRYAARAAKCGVSFNSSRMEVIGDALLATGADPNHPTPAQFAAAEAVLQRVRPYVRRIDSPSQISEMTSGSMCLLITSSTNVAIARSRSKEAGTSTDLRYIIPKEGAVSWLDTFAIPADAPHVAEAYALLDFLMRPEVAARNANFTGTATVNRAALPFVDLNLRNDPMLYPDAITRARLKPLQYRDAAQARAETQLWTRFEFQITP